MLYEDFTTINVILTESKMLHPEALVVHEGDAASGKHGVREKQTPDLAHPGDKQPLRCARQET